ncbi:unnamed protein product [Haemonchus placei]|uniref:CCHC-type domain-containing protein n=1 Tax=Haemonchus placei TaxID=6290 RepID=A0A0N4WHP8_HAEPC|nr:unnamed protein product [Haemonchus placei]
MVDDEHLSKLIEERKDDGGSVSVVVQYSSKRTTHTKKFESQRRRIESMEYALQRFPYRKLVAYSDGVEPQRPCVFCKAQSAHFSDSCPIVQDARTRNQIIDGGKLCPFCLEQCADRCGLKKKECWYCVRVYNTPFEDLIPSERHHKALCPVPEAKEQMHIWLEYALHEWQGMERGNRWGGRECRGWPTPRSTTEWY